MLKSKHKISLAHQDVELDRGLQPAWAGALLAWYPSGLKQMVASDQLRIHNRTNTLKR